MPFHYLETLYTHSLQEKIERSRKQRFEKLRFEIIEIIEIIDIETIIYTRTHGTRVFDVVRSTSMRRHDTIDVFCESSKRVTYFMDVRDDGVFGFGGCFRLGRAWCWVARSGIFRREHVPGRIFRREHVPVSFAVRAPFDDVGGGWVIVTRARNRKREMHPMNFRFRSQGRHECADRFGTCDFCDFGDTRVDGRVDDRILRHLLRNLHFFFCIIEYPETVVMYIRSRRFGYRIDRSVRCMHVKHNETP